MVGIIQEQHAERCRLFMQWKQMEFPVWVDSLNLLEVHAVPITLLIDEAGIIRFTDPDKEDLNSFLALPTNTPARPAIDPIKKPDWQAGTQNGSKADLGDQLRSADLAFLWGGSEGLDRAIDLYSKITQRQPGLGKAHFRLGTALRTRFEGDSREKGDFQKALDEWAMALSLDPNQYIWRRRIQQYGPRLDKPYPFYDWVHQARAELVLRGEKPVELRVEPGESEYAAPENSWSGANPEVVLEPDPAGRIHRDSSALVRIESALAGHSGVENRGLNRVHLYFRPAEDSGVHWNNEADPLTVWIEDHPKWTFGTRPLVYPNPKVAVDSGERHLEFEIQRKDEEPVGPPQGMERLKGYALYQVCRDTDGVCLYRRQDFEIPIP